MNNIAVVFFDIGGVLGSSVERAVYDTYLVTSENDVSMEEAWKLRSTYWKDLARGHVDELTYWNHIIEGLDLSYAAEKLRDAAHDQLSLVDGAADVVEAVSEEYRLGIISNHYTPWAEGILKDGDLEPFFDEELVFISDAEGIRKPDQRLYVRAVEAADVPPERIVFFDDSPANVNAARRAGMRSVQVDDPTGLYEDVRDAGLL